MSAPRLRLVDVAVARGGHVVLRVADLAVAAGEILVLLGPNGSGKSTLLLAAAGLLDLDGGVVLLDGEPFHRGRAPAPLRPRRRLASLLQEPLALAATVADDVAYGIRGPRALRRRRAAAVLDELGIAALAARRPGDLSVGERRQAALARALAVGADVLFVDEPTAALDAAARDRAEAALRAAAARGAALLLATHDAEQPTRLGARLVHLDSGNLVPGENT